MCYPLASNPTVRSLIGSLHTWHPELPIVILAASDLPHSSWEELLSWEGVLPWRRHDVLRELYKFPYSFSQFSDDDYKSARRWLEGGSADAVQDAWPLFVLSVLQKYPSVLIAWPEIVIDGRLDDIILPHLAEQGSVLISSSPESCQPVLAGWKRGASAVGMQLVPLARLVLDARASDRSSFANARKHLGSWAGSSQAQTLWSSHASGFPCGTLDNVGLSAQANDYHRRIRRRIDQPLPVYSLPADQWIKDPSKTAVALLVPTTSKGLDHIQDVSSMPLFRLLLTSLRGSIDGDGGTFDYLVYVGYDAGDAFWDRQDTLLEAQGLFRKIFVGRRVWLLPVRFTVPPGSPCWIWNGLARMAQAAGADYLYQLNDDVQLISSGWTPAFVKALESDSFEAGFGVVGGRDYENKYTITQVFVSVHHLDIFGSFYPPVFHNWYSDDWISQVYGPDHTRTLRDVTLINSVAAGAPRYVECKDCGQAFLQEELEHGCARIKQWLSASGRSESAAEFECADAWIRKNPKIW